MKITLICRGDNNWEETFENEEYAYWFLYSKLSEVERYYEDSRKHDFVFDIEDDCITWIEGDKKKYCAGWHWPEEQCKEQIVMLNSKSLYQMFSDLEN